MVQVGLLLAYQIHMSSEHSLSRPILTGGRAILLAAGLVGDAVAAVGVLVGLSGNVEFAKTWGALGLLVGVLSICILYLSDPPKAKPRAMGPSETPLRTSSGRRRRRRKRGFRLRLPFISQGWGWSEGSGYVDHGYYTRFDEDR